jgi:hypothetical protein
MQVWIVRLLSIGAAFSLSALIPPIFLFPACSIPRWSLAPPQLRRLQDFVEFAEIGESRLTPDKIDSWLAGRASKDVADPFGADADSDPWGHPYRVVAAEGPDRFGFYSTGRDGLSNSNGNDPDDINSWSEARTRYYEHEWLWGPSLIWLGWSAFLTPFVYTFAGIGCSIFEAFFGRSVKTGSAV